MESGEGGQRSGVDVHCPCSIGGRKRCQRGRRPRGRLNNGQLTIYSGRLDELASRLFVFARTITLLPKETSIMATTNPNDRDYRSDLNDVNIRDRVSDDARR